MNSIKFGNVNQTAKSNKILDNKLQTRPIMPAQKPDTFEKSSKVFNLDEAMATLKSLETQSIHSKPVFNDEQLEQIKTELTKTPEKYEPFKKLAEAEWMKGDIACRLAKKDKESLNELVDIANLRKDDYFGTPRFEPEELEKFANQLSAKELYRFKYLAQNIYRESDLIRLSKNKNLKAPEKVPTIIKEMRDLYKDNFSGVDFYGDYSDKKSFVCEMETGKKVVKQLLDSNLNRVALEESEKGWKNGSNIFTKKCVDYRANTTTKTVEKEVPHYSQTEALSEVRIIKDKKGNKVRTEYATQTDVAGALDVVYKMPNGSEQKIATASVDPKTGVSTIKKNMTSFDGTKTEYNLVEDKKGNRTLNYKITDKNGKVLWDNNQKFEVIDENKTVSTNNGKKYEMSFTDKNVSIKNLNNGETSSIEFENFVIGDKNVAIKLMKKMSGDELLALKKHVAKLEITDDNSFNKDKNLRTEGDNLGIFLHELGHAKDFVDISTEKNWSDAGIISQNKEIQKTYDKEKELFYKHFPITQRTHVKYFTDFGVSGLSEAIAESNEILNYKSGKNFQAFRSQYLQQYFPRTIALIGKELSK